MSFPFQAHVELLQLFLSNRKVIVERIQDLLNAQRKPDQYRQDRALLTQQFEDCCFAIPAVTAEQSRLRGQLQEAHWAGGFRPRQMPGLFNDLIHPAEMTMRAFHFWEQTRWPGRNARMHYAQALFNMYLLRCLEFMTMRLWDSGPGSASDRLAEIQALLDNLWRTSPRDQPVLVRDARWLIPLAQSPTTDALWPYFTVVEQVAETLVESDRIEVMKAGVQMIGGHLRSQIRHFCLKEGVTLDAHSVVLRTRASNALDFALLIQELVPLLGAYENTVHRGDATARFGLASAILQGISPDPELFLNRIDLLCPYSSIEHLFIATDAAGEVGYAPMGRRHLRLLQEYRLLIDRVREPLDEDCASFKPVDGGYSPYGAIFGTPSNLTEFIALKTLQRDAITHFGLEDAFSDGDSKPDKLAWADGWRKMPHINREIQDLYSYPQAFADEIFERIGQALRGRVADEASSPQTASEAGSDTGESEIPGIPALYVRSSSRHDEAELLRDRQEGHFLVSFETPEGWVAIHKDVVTEILGAGRELKIAGLPAEAAQVLRLMCPNIASGQASMPASILKA